jgi:hypothetical protein
MTQQVQPANPAAVEEFRGRLLGEFAVSAALPVTLLGMRLWLWQALAGAGPLAAQDVAEARGLPQPFVGEWLLTQAAGGYLDYDPHTGAAPRAGSGVRRPRPAGERQPEERGSCAATPSSTSRPRPPTGSVPA